MRDEEEISNSALLGRLLVFAAVMFGFGFALVPLYDVFCEITGFGGRTSGEAETVTYQRPDYSREVRVEFVTTVNDYAPWTFAADVDSMVVTTFTMTKNAILASATNNQRNPS